MVLGLRLLGRKSFIRLYQLADVPAEAVIVDEVHICAGSKLWCHSIIHLRSIGLEQVLKGGGRTVISLGLLSMSAAA